MKFKSFLILILILPLNLFSVSKFFYKEQWYVIFNMQLKKEPRNLIRNIWFLENALCVPFGNPEYAITYIETPKQYEKYKLLFKIHVNLLLVQQNLFLGDLYDTRKAYFFQIKEKDQRVENMKKAQDIYNIALKYYEVALAEIPKLLEYEDVYFENSKLDYWEDEVFRIQNKELDYKKIIERELNRIESVKNQFNNIS